MKTIHTPRDELVCGKLDLLEDKLTELKLVDLLYVTADIRHDCERMEAKLASRKLEEQNNSWQPIKTAPKDGSRLLLIIDHGEHGDKIWTGLWADGWVVSYGKPENDPTHWMPLPKAPI